MADDALSQSLARGDAGWGGARQRTWKQAGKKAVVNVDPQVYHLATVLAKLCQRTNQDLCSQVFAAGMEVLMGTDIEKLRTSRFAVSLEGMGTLKKAFTMEEVQARAKLIEMTHPHRDRTAPAESELS